MNLTKYAMLLGLAIIMIQAQAQQKNYLDVPYLETSAKVDTLVIPDMIYMQIDIRESDEKNKVSVEELETRMIKKLESLDIDTKTQLTLSDVSSNYQYYFLKGKNILKSKSYTLLVHDAQSVAKVILGLEEVGISNVYISKMDYDKKEDLQLALKEKAVAQTLVQAEYLTRPLNQKATKALYIRDNQSVHYFQNQMAVEEVLYNRKEVVQDEYIPPAIDVQPLRFETEIYVVYAIE